MVVFVFCLFVYEIQKKYKKKTAEIYSNKQSLSSKSSRDLESALTSLKLDGIDDENPTKYPKSKTPTTGKLQRSQSTSAAGGGTSTPRVNKKTTNKKKFAPKNTVKKRRKSFSLGMGSY